VKSGKLDADVSYPLAGNMRAGVAGALHVQAAIKNHFRDFRFADIGFPGSGAA